MEGWTDREIERSLALRRKPDGEIVAFEICSGCRNGFPKEEHRLGYGSGRALCRNCMTLERMDEKHTEEPAVLQHMGRGTWLISQLARTCKLTKDATEQTLLNLLKKGKVERKGKAWTRTETQSTLF